MTQLSAYIWIYASCIRPNVGRESEVPQNLPEKRTPWVIHDTFDINLIERKNQKNPFMKLGAKTGLVIH